MILIIRHLGGCLLRSVHFTTASLFFYSALHQPADLRTSTSEAPSTEFMRRAHRQGGSAVLLLDIQRNPFGISRAATSSLNANPGRRVSPVLTLIAAESTAPRSLAPAVSRSNFIRSAKTREVDRCPRSGGHELLRNFTRLIATRPLTPPCSSAAGVRSNLSPWPANESRRQRGAGGGEVRAQIRRADARSLRVTNVGAAREKRAKR